MFLFFLLKKIVNDIFLLKHVCMWLEQKLFFNDVHEGQHVAQEVERGGWNLLSARGVKAYTTSMSI